MSDSFIGFPSIESFHNVVRAIEKYPQLVKNTVNYRGKIKLHGTNSGIRYFPDKPGYKAMSHSQFLENGVDNVGFARAMNDIKEYLDNLDLGRWLKTDVIVFGEWCGPGIMKSTAIQQIPNKIFAIFAIQIGSNPETALFISDPDKITSILLKSDAPPGTFLTDIIIPDNFHILPWYGEAFTVNYFEREKMSTIVDSLNAIVAQVEPCDPWVKSVFGVDGICEGVVYYPYWDSEATHKMFSDLSFKAKGEKHKSNKTKEAVQIDPEVTKSIDDFLKMFVTESRLEQGLATVGELDMKKIPDFLKWIGQDIVKESVDELEVSDLEWSDVVKSVQNTARSWFIKKVKAV